MLHRLLDLLLPDLCQLCLQSVDVRKPHALCEACWQALPRVGPACIYCALPLERAGICAACLDQPERCRSFAPLRHDAESRYLLHRYKYHRDLRAGSALAYALQSAVVPVYSYQPRPTCLIPVPLSWRRQVSRGFDQADWLARRLGRRLAIPVAAGRLKRRHGPRQATLERTERLALASDTFRLRGALDHLHVAIVDDVLTTGATTRTLARLLRQHGVSRVDVWCTTRAVP